MASSSSGEKHEGQGIALLEGGVEAVADYPFPPIEEDLDHQVQFPPDIEVFYVAPPALDEIKRWFRTRDEEYQAQTEQESKE